jgi:hypothetical protein
MVHGHWLTFAVSINFDTEYTEYAELLIANMPFACHTFKMPFAC